MFDSTPEDHQSSTLVATFADRELAHDAAHRLHEEGFHKTWVGLTRPGESATQTNDEEPRVSGDNPIARFFGGGNETLADALVKHGVAPEDTHRVEETIPANSAILTVHGANHPERAAEIVASCGGRMIDSIASSRLGSTYSDRESYEGLGRFGGGRELDEERIVHLRAERLSVDKQRVDAGEAVVGKRVVSERTEFDVPLVREELYIERRPASGTVSGTIGDGERIVVPLSREELDVTKRTVATEDIAVGQRRIEEMGHVSETLRHEELDIDADSDNGVTPSSLRAASRDERR